MIAHGKGSSIKSGGVKLFLCENVSLQREIIQI